jgi:benzodiazapine receptor
VAQRQFSIPPDIEALPVTEIASRAQLRMSFLRWALVCVPAIVLLGTLSGLLSNSGYSNAWFRALRLPSFMPPGWVFPCAWTILYICLGLSLAMILHARGARGRGPILALFLVQLGLNYSWSPVFFAMHRVGLALCIIALMILLTAALIVMIWRVRRGAALLLVPYLVWLCFAASLNYRIWADNPDASQLAPARTSADILLH